MVLFRLLNFFRLEYLPLRAIIKQTSMHMFAVMAELPILCWYLVKRATQTHFEAFLNKYSIFSKLSHAFFTLLGHYFLKIFKPFHMEPGASNILQNSGYSKGGTVKDVPPKLIVPLS